MIDSQALYHILLERPSLNILGAVVSTLHLPLKFLILPTKVRVIHVDQKEARQCYHELLRKKGKELRKGETQEVHIVEIDQSRKMNMRDLDLREE